MVVIPRFRIIETPRQIASRARYSGLMARESCRFSEITLAGIYKKSGRRSQVRKSWLEGRFALPQ